MNGDRAQAASRIMMLSDRVVRWWARDFKPGTLPSSLTSTQLKILEIGEAEQGMNMSRIAERLDLSVPTVVRAVNALERKGFVERRRTSAKQRDVTVLVTESGHDCRAAVEKHRFRRFCRLLEDMSDDEVTALVEGYEGMARAVDGAGE